ncbi:hypothetical protein FBZ89_10682 [Nitrospirillum amazonense]|uniref:Uncharacterized protein n=1 Tax=Nitrospirillum amazonense TaxID=28077 RepID=A0A560FGE4_9PROT|nr:hypothetical protein [Nitrospirillum amazonense]TWB20683.1 hypothetical protein FBZ89_10682 [Nitrospirillum amazonense]
MTPFVTYDATGRIHAWGDLAVPDDLVDQNIAAQARDGLKAMHGMGHPDTHHVVDGAIEERPSLPMTADKVQIAADGIDAVTLTGLPTGAIVTLDAQSATADGATMAITTTLPGRHQVSVTCWPYRDLTLEITAHVPA